MIVDMFRYASLTPPSAVADAVEAAVTTPPGALATATTAAIAPAVLPADGTRS
ncbi:MULTISPECIES: hypothetical protein [Streptomyces]|uniref:Uncharacterized protein n=1 Tax=Streptomyces typhae TaxID=2681492 RepID=A0A6L6X380_9ACTN|nr:MULTISPECIES: hypothetical protein [Streptomyces]MVO88284.1 hypothetical protein [Streptomyces typhae]